MSTRKENIMGTVPINKLLPSMAMPIMLSMLIQALYSIVDGIFVAQIGTDAFAAVNLIFPIQSVMIGVAVGTAVGMNSLLSRRLGEKRFEEANMVANNGLMLCIVSALVFALIGAFGSEAFMRVNTSDEVIIALGTVYMQIVTIFSLGLFVQIAFERILQITGKTTYQMIAQGTGAIINIVLDPILIFGYFGFPEMGVAGAAVATVFAQWCGMLISIALNHFYNHEIKIKLKHLKPHWGTVKNIYIVGVPSIIMQSIGSVMMFGMNQILIAFTPLAVVAFGIYFKLISFMFMPVFGVVNALVPIVGYNFGARKKKRITQSIKLACYMCVGIMLAGTIAFWVIPEQLMAIFDADAELTAMGVPMLRITSVVFTSAAVCIVFSSVFQALGNGMLSMWMSVARQLVVLLPAAYLLAHFVGLNSVWYAFPISELVSLFLAVIFFIHIYNKRINTLKDDDPQTQELSN